jgi:tRNA pseudouridine38-40 synthase
MSDKRNIRLELSYDGSRYFGWQKQVNAPTVQGELEKALHVVLQSPTTVSGIGRTDSGAHAFRYVAHFHTYNFSIPEDRFPVAVNSVLPRDIRVLSASEMPMDFHSRFSAKAREYLYFVITGRQPLPHLEKYTHYLATDGLDDAVLSEACTAFAGQHHFRSFSSGYDDNQNFVRKIFRFRYHRLEASHTGISSLLRPDSSLYIFSIKGNGFLKGMIRTIISSCVSCAEGKIPVEMLKLALADELVIDSKYRSPVPASGLWFKRGYF